jgi:Outer membrane protein beta-barrel domain
MFKFTRIPSAISLLIIASLLIAASVAGAEPSRDRNGFFLGLDVAGGGMGFEFEKGGKKHEYRDQTGSALGIRLGYAFNSYVSLAIEGRSFGHKSGDFETSLCSQTLLTTVYPTGGGFFLRAGLGTAKFEVNLADDEGDGVLEEFDEEGGAIALGLGYDWAVNEHFAIGLSADVRGAVIDDFGSFEEMAIGEGTLGATMAYTF